MCGREDRSLFLPLSLSLSLCLHEKARVIFTGDILSQVDIMKSSEHSLRKRRPLKKKKLRALWSGCWDLVEPRLTKLKIYSQIKKYTPLVKHIKDLHKSNDLFGNPSCVQIRSSSSCSSFFHFKNIIYMVFLYENSPYITRPDATLIWGGFTKI